MSIPFWSHKPNLHGREILKLVALLIAATVLTSTFGDGVLSAPSSGTFTDSGQSPTSGGTHVGQQVDASQSEGVALADVDGDGDKVKGLGALWSCAAVRG